MSNKCKHEETTCLLVADTFELYCLSCQSILDSMLIPLSIRMDKEDFNMIKKLLLKGNFAKIHDKIYAEGRKDGWNACMKEEVEESTTLAPEGASLRREISEGG
jgi:hypothetical protein